MRRYHKWGLALDMIDGDRGSTDRCRHCGALRYWGNTNVTGYRAAAGAEMVKLAPPCAGGQDADKEGAR